jgi:hypothetical protein
VRLVELPSGRDCTPRWDVFARDDGLEGGVFHRAIALSPDGKLLALGLRRVHEPFGGFGMGGFGRRPNADADRQNPGALYLLDTGTGARHRTLARKVGVDVVAFSRDGKLLAAKVQTAAKSEIKVWDLAMGKETLSIDPHGYDSALAFSPDGRSLLIGSLLGFSCWSTATGKRLWTSPLPDRLGRQLSMSISPDGSRLAAHEVGRPGVWLLDAGNGKVLHTLEPPGDPGEQVASFFQNAYSKGFGVSALPSATHGSTLSFSSDGKVLAAASPAGVQVWDVASGQALRRSEVLARSLAFLPGGGPWCWPPPARPICTRTPSPPTWRCGMPWTSRGAWPPRGWSSRPLTPGAGGRSGQPWGQQTPGWSTWMARARCLSCRRL